LAIGIQRTIGLGENLADAAQYDTEMFGEFAASVVDFNSMASKQAIEAEGLVIEIEKKIQLRFLFSSNLYNT
jgi:hypothetical protein